MVSVISSQVGGERYQGYEHETENVVPDESSVGHLDVPEMLLMSIPEGTQGEERQRIDQELRNERNEVPQDCLIGTGAGYIRRHIDSQNQQGHGKGEESIGQSLEAAGPQFAFLCASHRSQILTIREGFYLLLPGPLSNTLSV